MAALRVVVVSPEPPDPFGNAAGRWYYVLAKGLSERGSNVHWFSAYTNLQSAERAQSYLSPRKGLELELHPHPKRNWLRQKLLTLRQPYSYFISEGLRKAVDQELRQGYDVLHLEQTWAGWLGMGMARAVLSVHWLACVDLAGAPADAPRLLASAALMKRTERHITANFETIRALSVRDQTILKQLSPRARVAAIPLALDHSLYEFSTREPQEPTLGLVGSMDWLPTRLAAVRLLEDIWPRVKTSVRGLKLLIGGWGARRALAKYVGEPNVTILEDLPNVEAFFRQLSLLVFPLKMGSGVKVKVLEAMAYGVPVVTTQEGIEGINAIPGIHAAIAEDDDKLAIRIADLMSDPEGRQEMRFAARKLIEEQHSPSAILPQIEALYEEIIHSTPHSSR